MIDGRPFHQLGPVEESKSDYDEIERKIITLLKREFYYPILALIGKAKGSLQNAKRGDSDFSALWEALNSGRITFSQGTFSGTFNAATTRALKKAGARWDRGSSTFKCSLNDLPIDLQNVVRASESRFKEKIKSIDKHLSQVSPELISGKLSLEKLFDASIWKADSSFRKNVKNIGVVPELKPHEVKRLAKEWQNNMHLYVTDFTQSQIKSLREEVKKSVFSGNRYGSLIDSIQKSYRVTQNKAKFLARQESHLLLTKFKEVRYQDAGINEYTWHAVTGTKDHPTRPRHKALAEASKRGKTYRWDDPPITTEPGEVERRNNPGQDFNCRCFARPVVRNFGKDKKR